MPIEQPQLRSGLFGRSGTPRALKPTATGAPPPKAPAGVQIEHRIGVQAPAEVIWDVVADLEAWAGWNPTYPKAAGVIRIGSVLDMTLALPGQAPQEIHPTVLEWVPNEQLHWRLTMLGGLVKTLRYIEIEALAESGCVVSNGEYFAGLVGPSVAKRMGRAIFRGFREMNAARTDRAEALWATRKA